MESNFLTTDSSQQLDEVKGLDLDLIQDQSSRQRVLVVDDDKETVTLMKVIMSRAGFNVAGALSGSEALEKVPEVNPHVVLLDLMMPEMDGLETFHHLKKMTQAPVIIVSAATKKEKIVESLNQGLDDYVTKPFHTREMVARVKAVMRRSQGGEQRSSRYIPSLDLLIDFETREVTFAGNRIDFTPKEFKLFALLAERAPKLVTYRQIAEHIWGEYSDEVKNRIKYLIHLIRHKLELDHHECPQLISNRVGVGYSLEVEMDD